MPKQETDNPRKTTGKIDQHSAIIRLGGAIGLATIEGELSRSYSLTTQADKVVFDLSHVSWIGYLPAALLFSWASLLLSKKGRQVQLVTAPHREMNDQVRAILFGQGVADLLEELGAELPEKPSPMFRRGQPITVVSSIDDLWVDLKETGERIINSQKLPAGTDRVLRDAFQTILYELVENAFIHTGGAFPHYGVSLARAGISSNRSQGLISTFDAGTDYLEAYVGDLGSGLQAGLEESMSDDYEPPFLTSHRFLKAERVLAYALEFSTTSDTEGRLRRLRQLLSQPNLDPGQIATGLYCVAELARSLGGQFLIRTPKAILSFEFHRERGSPEVKGRKELGLDTLGALPGTHYLVRLPLTLTRTAKTAAPRHRHPSASVPLTRTLNPFATIDGSDPMESILQAAISNMDAYLMRNRQSLQIATILPPPFPLPSRAEALFIAAVGAMNHGKCLVLWASKHAQFTVRNSHTQLNGSSIAGQAMLIGDLFSNSFRAFGHSDPRWRSLLTTEDFGEALHLREEVISGVRFEHRKVLDETLRLTLTSPGVKHSGDSFLLEGQYYTETFYEIDRAWEDPNNIRIFAEWALSKLKPGVDVLIAHAAPIFKMVRALAELMKEYLGVEPLVIEHELDQSPAKTISQLVSLSGHHALIITDVICTADRLHRFLNLVTGVELDGILALVDGRTSQPQQPIPWLLPSANRFLQIDAILTEKIEVYKDPPTRSRRTPGIGDIEDEQVYVIDRGTRAPSLYVRPAKPQVSFERLLKGPGRESKALLTGHTEFRSRHYLYFLHFPQLFEYLQHQIMEWVKHQIDYVEQSPKSKGQSWHVYVYTGDDSLSWMLETLPDLSQKPTVRSLTYEHLRAPLPPRQGEASGNWIIILPALASGETARLSLEYVSRQNPATLLLLCIASRMDPYHLTFYGNVSQYGGADLHMACFIEFPVPTFAIGRGACPQCAELFSLRELRDLVVNLKGESVGIVEALGRKISANQAVPLRADSEDDWLAREPTEEDSEKAYLRALYESAFVNIENRRKLNAILVSDPKSVDRFLQILSAERLNNQFSPELMNSILYKADVTVRNRLIQIILEWKPPFPIGRVMGSVVHLLPHIFVTNAVAMIKRYSSSQRDVEEICIGLLVVGIEPSDVADFFAASRAEPTAAVSTLFRETVEVLRATRAKDRRDFDQSIEATVRLWAQLVRSSQFSEAVATLAQTPVADYLDWVEIRKVVSQISHEWKNRIIELITRIESGPLWLKVKSRSTRLPKAVTRLETSIAKLELLGRAPNQQPLFGADRSSTIIQAIAKEIEHSGKEIARELFGFIINPVMCSAAELGETLVTNDGSELRVIKEIDQRVPKVFFDPEDLTAVCGQLIGNWKKHKTSANKGTTVKFRIFPKDGEVVLAFSDDIEGEFDLQSRGGLAVVLQCCQENGGIVRTATENGFKTITIHLRAVDSK